MKGKIITGIILTILLSCFYGCKKEENHLLNHQNVNIENDLQVKNMILKFKDRMKYLKQHPAIKDVGTMSIKDAIWYLESDFNFTYGYVNLAYRKMLTDTADFVIAVNNDQTVNEMDVSALYDEMLTHLIDYYNSVDNGNLRFNSLKLRDMGIENNMLNLRIIASFGFANSGQDGVFGSNDYWYYGYGLGHCGNIEEGDGYDAATELERSLLVYYGPGANFGNVHIFYTDIFDTTLVGNEFPNPADDALDNNMDYLLFYCSESVGGIGEDEACLNPEEMNHYRNGTQEVINLLKPEGKLFITCDIDGINEIEEDEAIIHHSTYLKYGKRHVVIINEEEYYPIDMVK